MARPALGAVLLVGATLAAAQEPAPSGDASVAEAEEQPRAHEKGSADQQEGTIPCPSSIRVTGLQLHGMNGVYFRDNSKMLSGRETYWMMQGDFFTYKCGQDWYTTLTSSYASVAAPGNTLCRWLTRWTGHLTVVSAGTVHQWDGTRNVAQPNARSLCASNTHCGTGRSLIYPCMCGSYRDGGCVTAQSCSPSASRKCSRCPAVRVHGIDAAINSMLGSIGQPAWAFRRLDGSYSRADHKMVKGRPTYWLNGDGSYFFYYCNKRWHMLASLTNNWQALNSIADSACTSFLTSRTYDWHQDAPLGHASWQLVVGALSQWKQLNHNDWYSVMTCPNADSHPTVYPTAYPTGYPAYSVESQSCISLGSDCYRTRYADADGNYGNGDSCNITVHSGPLRVQVIRFQTEFVWDTLRVDSTPYSGTSSPHNAIVHNSLQWSSDGSVTYPGWHICLHRLSVPTQFPTWPTQYPTSPTQWPTAPTQWPTAPTQWPTAPTSWPTTSLTGHPTAAASTPAPTAAPVPPPTLRPSGAPSTAPTAVPTEAPILPPTALPTGAPAAAAAVLQATSDCLDLGGGCFRTSRTRLGTYRNKARCDWTINHPVRIVMHQYDVEAGNDHLVIDGAPYTGASGPDGVIVSSSLGWRSDGSQRASGVHMCLVPAVGLTRFPTSSPTAFPTGLPTRTAAPHRTGFPSTGFPAKTGFPQRTAFPTRPPTSTNGSVQISSCAAGAGPYTVDGAERDSPCNLHGDSRHVNYVADHNGRARLYACSRAGRHHFALCTCRGPVCADDEVPTNCFVPANHAMGCVGTLRGAAFSADGTKVYFACNKEVRACRVDLSSRDGQLYSDCQVVERAGCPRWAAIRGLAIRPRPSRGDLLVVACTDRKTRACSLHADNMNMQEGRMCVKGGPEQLCTGIGKPSGLAFSADNRLIAQCDRGYSYSRFVGGIVQSVVHVPYNGSAPCPRETNAIAESGPGRAAVACGPDGVRECLIRYS